MVVSRTRISQCGWCGKEFTARWSHKENRWTKFCSTSCSQKNRYAVEEASDEGE